MHKNFSKLDLCFQAYNWLKQLYMYMCICTCKTYVFVKKMKLYKKLKRWEYQTTWPASWETCMQAKKHQLELDMEQWTSSKLGKEYVKAVYCHLAY